LTCILHRSIHYIAQVVVVGAAIPPILTVRNLGAMFDQSLTMDDFVKHICKLLISTSTIFHPSEIVFRKSLSSYLYMLLSVAGWTTAIPC